MTERVTLVEYYNMIRSLTGNIQETGEGWLVIEVNDIGYVVYCNTTTNTFETGQEITLYTYLAVRETALDLYGFSSKSELDMFTLFLGVPKVGPKSALQVLNLATPNLIIESAQKNDGVYLHKLSGVGKKTAENIIQYLQNKLEILPVSTNTNSVETNQTQTDAIDALISLGYATNTARDIVLKIYDKDSTVNSLVTQALKEIQ